MKKLTYVDSSANQDSSRDSFVYGLHFTPDRSVKRHVKKLVASDIHQSSLDVSDELDCTRLQERTLHRFFRLSSTILYPHNILDQVHNAAEPGTQPLHATSREYGQGRFAMEMGLLRLGRIIKLHSLLGSPSNVSVASPPLPPCVLAGYGAREKAQDVATHTPTFLPTPHTSTTATPTTPVAIWFQNSIKVIALVLKRNISGIVRFSEGPSSAGPTTLMVPQELIDSILSDVDDDDDSDSLRACALASKCFLTPAQRLLFKEMSFPMQQNFRGRKVTSKYYIVCAMILESGALYCAGGILFAVLAFYPLYPFTNPSSVNFTTALDIMPTGPILGQLVGIAPTIIAVRVGLGKSVESLDSFSLTATRPAARRSLELQPNVSAANSIEDRILYLRPEKPFNPAAADESQRASWPHCPALGYSSRFFGCMDFEVHPQNRKEDEKHNLSRFFFSEELIEQGGTVHVPGRWKGPQNAYQLSPQDTLQGSALFAESCSLSGRSSVEDGVKEITGVVGSVSAAKEVVH
ncbi:hypothetical protein B0H13DRAFT_1857254 [Mycena leptocephala]|nr:hypothetical protein B0H13DRAFT_1857254 [Mycena leptocephala]